MTDNFEQEMALQNDYLRKQLHALQKLPTKQRLKYVRLTIMCAPCQEVVLEVVGTEPYPVVRYRQTTRHPNTSFPAATAPVSDWIGHARTAGPSVRQDEWSFYPVPNPTPVPDPAGKDWWGHRSLINTSCRRWQHNLTEEFVFTLISNGVAKHMLHHG